jgi:hypothetical protein
MLMNKIPETMPPSTVNGFDQYGDFLVFAKMLFDLKAGEYKALYKVLLKLQSVGEDPIQTMLQWKNRMDEKDCLDLIRFMIQVEAMDLEQFSKAA